MKQHSFDELKKEVNEIRDKYPALSMDNAFIAWFLRAFITENEDSAIKAIKGGANDKGVDAIFTDHDSRIVFIVQGKYHQVSKPPSAGRSDLIALADLGHVLLKHDPKEFYGLLFGADATVKEELKKVRRLLISRNYSLHLQFVTTGKVSKTHKKEAESRVDDWENANFQVFSRRDLIRLVQDYIEGAAPPVPTISLPINGEELFTRFDDRTGISSWVFTMIGDNLGEIFNEIGVRLFARNIRGFLGNTDINRGMEGTLKNESDHFWYFNNGVTIVCDEAKQITQHGKKNLRVTNAQIINGQQTTRILAKHSDKSKATLLVKVFSIPRDSEEAQTNYNHLISSIVSATNWQNAIKQSDLKSNDIAQVQLDRELRKIGYHYLRKKQTISEAKRITGRRYSWYIKKEDLAKYAAACLLDPYEIRLGVNRLFEDDIYSKIFDGRHSTEYVTFYWLHRIVSWHSKGDSRRGYAKWLAINFIWSNIGNKLKQKNFRNKFRHIAERHWKYDSKLKPLRTAIDRTFNGALALYRENKRTEDGIIDESSYFKHKNLHNKFFSFFEAPKNKKRYDFIKKRLDTFIDNIELIEI